MTKGKCEDCIYYTHDRFCNRYPPTMAVTTNEEGEIIPVIGFPDVDPEDWCGEFKVDKLN